ncbi:hypothetical protein K2173_021080 [Erythroxylum novogranatense]|uniref:Uncharacterized protein n=1 Tax=Erythroxylum novogranatense TaxID=1862640 RepID=A0AAV8TPG9_9ROSI|nr:hypothetical protein K2173_021080 [Erythroxylum novogranatense]
MAAGAADGFFRYVGEGCLFGGDMGIERRPYHRNCQCALHKNRKNCSHGTSNSKNVSYPIRRSWSEGSLALTASCHSSPSSSPSMQPLEDRGGSGWDGQMKRRNSSFTADLQNQVDHFEWNGSSRTSGTGKLKSHLPPLNYIVRA